MFQWLILSQFFHKWRNTVKFFKEFIFVIIECINMQITTIYHFCNQKGEFDIILMYNTGLHVIAFSAFRNLKSTSFKTHHTHAVYQNNIKFAFLMTKVTNCWNLHVDTFSNTKYKFFKNFTMFLHFWKNWDKISQYWSITLPKLSLFVSKSTNSLINYLFPWIIY